MLAEGCVECGCQCIDQNDGHDKAFEHPRINKLQQECVEHFRGMSSLIFKIPFFVSHLLELSCRLERNAVDQLHISSY